MFAEVAEHLGADAALGEPPLPVDFRKPVEVVAGDDIVNDVIDTIVKTARTGQVGDGKIFVTQLSNVVRIRTGETDKAAV